MSVFNIFSPPCCCREQCAIIGRQNDLEIVPDANYNSFCDESKWVQVAGSWTFDTDAHTISTSDSNATLQFAETYPAQGAHQPAGPHQYWKLDTSGLAVGDSFYIFWGANKLRFIVGQYMEVNSNGVYSPSNRVYASAQQYYSLMWDWYHGSAIPSGDKQFCFQGLMDVGIQPMIYFGDTEGTWKSGGWRCWATDWPAVLGSSGDLVRGDFDVEQIDITSYGAMDWGIVTESISGPLIIQHVSAYPSAVRPDITYNRDYWRDPYTIETRGAYQFVGAFQHHAGKPHNNCPPNTSLPRNIELMGSFVELPQFFTLSISVIGDIPPTSTCRADSISINVLKRVSSSRLGFPGGLQIGERGLSAVYEGWYEGISTADSKQPFPPAPGEERPLNRKQFLRLILGGHGPDGLVTSTPHTGEIAENADYALAILLVYHVLQGEGGASYNGFTTTPSVVFLNNFSRSSPDILSGIPLYLSTYDGTGGVCTETHDDDNSTTFDYRIVAVPSW